MSKVAIQGNASGTGTFTIAAPNSDENRTLTLPDEAGTVLTSGGSHLMVDSYYMTSSQTLTNTSQVIGVDDSMTWTHDTNSYFGSIGTGMSESSGTFTFPSTGIYKITAQLSMDSDGSDSNIYSQLQGSSDGGSTWFSMRYSSDYTTTNGQNTSHPMADFYKVTNTANDKVRLQFSGATGATALGSRFYTFVIFERVGDV
jgi:hypothetical protein